MFDPKANSKTLRVVAGVDIPLSDFVLRHLTLISAQPIKSYASLAEAAVGATQVLLPLPSALECLARGLVDAPSCVGALDEWKAGAGALLADTRRMRRTLVLADTRSLLSNDANVLAVLGITRTPDRGYEDHPPMPSLMMLALANALLANDTEACRLVAEIDAMRYGSHVAPLGIEELDAAHKEYTNLTGEIARLKAVQQQADKNGIRLKALERVKAELDEENGLLRENTSQQTALIVENTLLRENIAQQMSGAKQAEAMRAQLEEEASSLRKIHADRHLVKAQAEALISKTETHKQHTASRKAGLSVVLLEDEKAKQTAAVKTAVSDTSAQKLSGEIAFLKGELNRVYKSKSWRLTRPLRKVRSVLGKT